MALATPALEIRNLHKRYGELEVLKGISLTARDGDVISILGSSGSGKSTLLRCINLLENPHEGQILVAGEELKLKKAKNGELVAADGKQINRMRSELGFVFQNFNLWPHMTILDNIIEAPRRVLGQSKAEAIEVAEALLAKVGIAEKRHAYPSELSGGMARRVALARTIALDPELMLYDEPFTGLDPISLGVIAELIAKINTALGATSIMVTHDIQRSLEIVNKVIFLAHGEIIFSGSPAEMRQLDSPWISQFIHGSANGPVEFRYPAPTTLQHDLMTAAKQ